MDELVPEEAIDYDEVLRRGGANHGDEDFALFKCPHCGRVYLLEYEADTVYLDPEDLSKRLPIRNEPFACVACERLVPADEPWVGAAARLEFGVTRGNLVASGWGWAVRWPKGSS
ncbi:MAG: CpXC domain-containing protein [Gemmataceae bacterium]|nr:CpXC domain-containing protein [Gemmataceae bacterium]